VPDYQSYRLGGFAYFRLSGERTIMIHAIGPPTAKVWAFSIWLGGECLTGRSDPKWDARRAKLAADKADASIPQ
jgi:hypothetical protein